MRHPYSGQRAWTCVKEKINGEGEGEGEGEMRKREREGEGER